LNLPDFHLRSEDGCKRIPAEIVDLRGSSDGLTDEELENFIANFPVTMVREMQMKGPLSRRIDQLEQAVAMAVTAECSAENPAGADASFPGTDDPIVIHHALIDQIRQVTAVRLKVEQNQLVAGMD